LFGIMTGLFWSRRRLRVSFAVAFSFFLRLSLQELKR
jgi:hypothetical protein